MKRQDLILGFAVVLLSIFLMFWGLESVDLEASEDIYVADAVAYIRRDPYIVPRHHLRKPHHPASPHPFLVPMLAAEIMKRLDLNLFSARALQAGSVVATCLLVMWIARQMFDTKSAIAAGL